MPYKDEEKRKAYEKARYIKNKDKNGAYCKEYYLNNKDRKKAYYEKYRIENRERLNDMGKAYSKEYYAKNRERKNETNRAWRTRNSEKLEIYGVNYRKKNKARSRAHYLKRTYALTQAEYMEMYSQQEGKCAICGIFFNPYSETSTRREILHVDHCHKTGKVRGLLCVDCNLGLGCFDDNKNSLLNAIDYLVQRGGGV